MPQTKRSFEETLKNFTVSPTGCHEWTLSKQGGGYGQIGRASKQGTVLTLAHRARWIVSNGPIPPDMIVRHKCDNRCCININHLELGTHKDNAADMWERGRAGSRNGKLRQSPPQKRIFLSSWRRREDTECAHCRQTFKSVISEKKRGRGLFCSPSCAVASRKAA